MNPAKCATLRFDVDGEAKRWVINPTTMLNINRQRMRATSDDAIRKRTATPATRYIALNTWKVSEKLMKWSFVTVGLLFILFLRPTNFLTNGYHHKRCRMHLIKCLICFYSFTHSFYLSLFVETYIAHLKRTTKKRSQPIHD